MFEAKLDKTANISEINEIVNIIHNVIPVIEIYIFGSFANGTAGEDSDYDFYVVIPDNSLRAREATWKIREALVGKQKRGIDMLVGTQSKFKNNINTYSIENEVAKTGVKLYG
ncbi:MAG: nucleotidyltransferase domain-containing protein [Oscillospiraceae bacterium]|nr:nucleotidyltransferase domain-containing protein [Oscillospiraceae bacterium]